MSLPDAFTGSNGTELHAYDALWVSNTQDTGVMEIQSNAAHIRNSPSATGVYLYDQLPASADYSVKADVVLTSGLTGIAGVVGRASKTANTFYLGRFNNNNIQLYKFVAGTGTQLGSDVASGVSSNGTYSIELSMNGSTIKVFFNGVEKISQTDSAITANGYGGMRFNASEITIGIDNFDVTNMGGGATDLVIADSSHAHTAENVTLTLGSSDLSIADSTHAHTAENVTLTTVGEASLVVADSSHAHTAENVTLGVVYTLISLPLVNNTGTVLAGTSGWTVNVYDTATGELVLQSTGLTADSNGILRVHDAALAPGSYAYEPVNATYGRRLQVKAVT